jgi:hypothetical protein
MDFEFKKKATQIRANHLLERRGLTGSLKWIFIFKVNDVDVCAVYRGAKVLPVITSVYQMYTKLFPSFPTSCPILPGNYSARNVTMLSMERDNMNKSVQQNQLESFGVLLSMISKLTPVLPNGYYRNIITFSTKNDPIGLTLSWVTQVEFRMNDDEFK